MKPDSAREASVKIATMIGNSDCVNCSSSFLEHIEHQIYTAIVQQNRGLPIETAPKDGSSIILITSDNVYAPCMYQKEGVISEDPFWLWWQALPEALTEVANPLYWKPMPELPTNET